MRIFISIIIGIGFLASYTTGYAQTLSLDTVKVNKKDTSDIVVTAIKMNVLYRGLDNPVYVSIPANVDKVIVECSCERFYGSNGKYIIKPGAEKSIELTVSQIKKNKIKKTEKFKFRVKSVPTPIIMWANSRSGETIGAQVASSSTLIPRMEDFDFDVYCTINSYDIRYTYGDKTVERTGISTNQIPQDLAKEIKTLPSGTKIYFDNIKITVPGGDKRIQSAVFTIQ